MPTKHRRRFHTDRIVRNRRALLRRLGSPEIYGHQAELPLGYWADRHPLDCGVARCGICHSLKFWDDMRRTRQKRAWRREVDEQLAEIER